MTTLAERLAAHKPDAPQGVPGAHCLICQDEVYPCDAAQARDLWGPVVEAAANLVHSDRANTQHERARLRFAVAALDAAGEGPR